MQIAQFARIAQINALPLSDFVRKIFPRRVSSGGWRTNWPRPWDRRQSKNLRRGRSLARWVRHKAQVLGRSLCRLRGGLIRKAGEINKSEQVGWSWGCVSAIDREGRTIWMLTHIATMESVSFSLIVKCSPRQASGAQPRPR